MLAVLFTLHLAAVVFAASQCFLDCLNSSATALGCNGASPECLCTGRLTNTNFSSVLAECFINSGCGLDTVNEFVPYLTELCNVTSSSVPIPTPSPSASVSGTVGSSTPLPVQADTNVGAIAGGTVAGVIVLGLIGAALYWILLRRRRQSPQAGIVPGSRTEKPVGQTYAFAPGPSTGAAAAPLLPVVAGISKPGMSEEERAELWKQQMIAQWAQEASIASPAPTTTTEQTYPITPGVSAGLVANHAPSMRSGPVNHAPTTTPPPHSTSPLDFGSPAIRAVGSNPSLRAAAVPATVPATGPSAVAHRPQSGLSEVSQAPSTTRSPTNHGHETIDVAQTHAAGPSSGTHDEDDGLPKYDPGPDVNVQRIWGRDEKSR